ncbi:MAG: SDR family NAD(P)-dependent oxidoreductase [Actinobacteria bacterium]|nr:SDR family NAD(P)-dependent oxidoreductase [Actinomycetota bacterium]
MDLAGAVVLVTGASSGIGRATAAALARAGALVVAHGRNAPALAGVATELGVHPVAADLTDLADVARLATAALQVHGRVDVLVNNAGAGWLGPAGEMPAADLRRLVQLNLAAPLHLTTSLLPAMLARHRGHVVNVTSIAGYVGVKHEAVYAATKAGLTTFTESLRYELRGTGVGVSTVTPAVVATAFFERRGAGYQRRRPRPVPPERVARAILRAVVRERDVTVPSWLAVPIWLHGAWPSLYRALAARFG